MSMRAVSTCQSPVMVSVLGKHAARAKPLCGAGGGFGGLLGQCLGLVPNLGPERMLLLKVHSSGSQRCLKALMEPTDN